MELCSISTHAGCDGGTYCLEHGSVLALIIRAVAPSLDCPSFPTAEEAMRLWWLAQHHNGPSTLSSISAIIEAEDGEQFGLAISLARILLEESI